MVAFSKQKMFGNEGYGLSLVCVGLELINILEMKCQMKHNCSLEILLEMCDSLKEMTGKLIRSYPQITESQNG